MKLIDSDDYAAAGIETMVFPGGEPHVKVPFLTEPHFFFLKLRSWSDIGFAALLLDAVWRQRASYIRHEVFIPYFPGARQDRSDGLSPLTASVIGNMLALPWARFMTFDIHSAAARMMAGRPINIMPSMFDDWQPRRKIDYIISPDDGAKIRAGDFSDRFCGLGNTMVLCEKVREFSTGRIKEYRVPLLPGPGHYCVVDDICDGGATFNLLADAIDKDPSAKDVTLELFVSHGIFSRGLLAISPRYEHITTTDSWCHWTPRPARLDVIPLLPNLFSDIDWK